MDDVARIGIDLRLIMSILEWEMLRFKTYVKEAKIKCPEEEKGTEYVQQIRAFFKCIPLDDGP